MILTWVFRVLFVPLLALAIITSTCSAAKAVDIDVGLRRVDVAEQPVRASANGAEVALVVRIPLNDTFAIDVRLGYRLGDDPALVANVSRSEPDNDDCFGLSVELPPLEHPGIDSSPEFL